MNRSRETSRFLLRTLRESLRQSGWTAKRIAAEFGIGEATAKRWLAGRGLTLDKLDALAALCDMTVGELARLSERPDPHLAEELTLAQERALTSDIFLSFLFMTILAGYRPDEIARDFRVRRAEMDAALARLERLALIDRLPADRVRPLIDRAIVWRKTPMRELFEQHMKPQFVAMDFAAANAVYASEVMKLSDKGAATLAEMIEQHRRDVQALAERDRDEANLPGTWYGMLCALRPLDMTQLDRG